MELLPEDIQKLLVATLLGAIIGIDREWRGKAAGFRTLMLVSMGSALFTLVSYKMIALDPHYNSDVTRIASNIVTGIGFLGAGIIFRRHQDVQGLTTAATVWAAAAIGMAVAIGSYWIAVISTVLTWLTLSLVHVIEGQMEKYFSIEKYTISWDWKRYGMISCEEFFGDGKFVLKQHKITKTEDKITAEWSIRSTKKNHQEFIKKVLEDERIVGLIY